MKRRSCLLLAFVTGTYLSACAGSARAEPYAFTLISEVAADDVSLFGASVNAAGLVSFSGTPPSRLRGVYVGDGGALTRITDVSDERRFASFFTTAINDSGAVAFGAGRRHEHGGDGVYVSSGGIIYPIAEPGPLYTGVGGNAPINSNGRVAFNASTPASRFNIFTSDGSTVTTIATERDVTGLGGPSSINASGTVVFFANLIGGGDAILAGNGGPLTVIADTREDFTFVGVSSAINDSGLVVFNAVPTGGVHGVYVGDGSFHQLLADSTGAFGSFANPVINNQNDVAFLGFFDGGGSGIFTGPDLVQNRVVGIGDTLLGTTVADIWFAGQGLNDNGSIAFWAQLSDGRVGVFRADPNPIPEPTTVALIGLGALGWLGYGWRRRRATYLPPGRRP